MYWWSICEYYGTCNGPSHAIPGSKYETGLINQESSFSALDIHGALAYSPTFTLFLGFAFGRA